MVLDDACLFAGKAHASVMTVFEYLGASEEMKTVQKNECKLFNHLQSWGYIVFVVVVFFFCRFCFSLIRSVET